MQRYTIICLLASSALYADDVKPAQPSAPNFVLILTDDQSWVGSSLQIDPDDKRTKSDFYKTPRIEELAMQGMRFTQGYAPAPFCCPTRRSILTGQTPAKHVYQKNQQNWLKTYREQLTLPQMLKNANSSYRTAHFGKWDMRYDKFAPEEVGYDVSDGYTDNGTGDGKGSGAPPAQDDPKLIFQLAKKTCDFMEESAKANKPFFVQISHYAVHLDIQYRQKTLDDAKTWAKSDKHTMPEFAAMTSDLDEGVGIVLDKIKALGLSGNTYVFFMSDNGGRLKIDGEKGTKSPRNYPLRDGKGTMYEGGIRVPFIVSGPGISAHTVSRVPVTGLDIFPTIAELAGYKKALPKALDGGSMLSVLKNSGNGSVNRANPFLFFHQAVDRDAQSALILGNYKMVKTWKKGSIELFDLSKDVSEANNLSKKEPDLARKLHGMMTQFIKEVDAETARTGSKEDAYKRATSE